MTGPDANWTDVVNSNVLGYSSGYALGYTHGYSRGYYEAQLEADRHAQNQQISRAGVINISTEIARAKADGREPRLYVGRSA